MNFSWSSDSTLTARLLAGDELDAISDQVEA
jgi:hypothetical protein